MIHTLDDHAKYMINSAQAYAPGSHDDIHITPDNKLSEGIDSVQQHRPAPWLPVIRYDKEFRTHVVISSQKPVAHATDAEGNSYLVPAGYAILLEENDTELKYTKEDVKAGVLNAEGNPVQEGDSVIASVKAADIKISNFVGIVNYNVFKHAGGDGINPNYLNYRNYNPQPTVSYNMDYAYEYPMVKDDETYATAPLEGIAAFVGEKAMPGQFITYDKNSNFILAEEDGFEYGNVKPTRILGQVSKVTKLLDPATGATTANSYNQLNRVINAAHLAMPLEGLNDLPGMNNKGLVTKVSYSNGYGVISFSLQTR